MAKAPKFTDAIKFTRPYVRVADQGEGYLAERFRQIRAEQERNEAERKAKVRQVRRNAP